ncbi:relaxase [uncultured Tateyamaria sp.]|uniref:relaxase/mobilization nuclease domain-containing protein n=1 Tax=uncultured Tateyamaria sp. TaxID=455651 RepID=UPI002621D414|nr:relaxase [uncultured Tateyamaria sp.]
MLFVGNQRGGGRDLALHLMKDDNERVEVHDIRGFSSNDLEAAFKESFAVSRATKCKQHLFSLSINPPPTENVSDKDFEDTIARAERTLGLSGQPRAIVFHEKQGRDGEVRRHAHAVYCRIKTDEMKAVQLSFTKDKLMKLSREIYLERDWRMPDGMLHKPDRDPRKFSLEQWQQAKRAGKDPEKLIGIFQDCWSVSDNAASFSHALDEHGYVLAKGRRGFVAVDHEGEVYAVSKWTKKRAKEVRQKLGEADKLPTVDQAHEKAATRVTDRLKEIQAEKDQEERLRLDRLVAAQDRQKQMQDTVKARILAKQHEKQVAESQAREDRLRKGFWGLLDRITGQRRRMLQENDLAAKLAQERDEKQRQGLQSRQSSARVQAQQKSQSIKEQFASVQNELQHDVKRLEPKDNEAQIRATQKRLAQNRNRRRERTRNRDGPSLER